MLPIKLAFVSIILFGSNVDATNRMQGTNTATTPSGTTLYE